MIGTEDYYNKYLNGHSAAQIRTSIRGLKNEIGRLKNRMEHPDYRQRQDMPDDYAMLCCAREYLSRAKDALSEVGEQYVPSQAELKALYFDNNIGNITRLDFWIGGINCLFGKRTYQLEAERVLLIQGDNSVEVLCGRKQFLDGIRSLHIGEWRHEYNLHRFGYEVLDGIQWELDIYFLNGVKSVKIYGNNAYPYNFDKLCKLLGVELEF